MLQAASLTVMLAIFWLLLSGFWDNALLLWLGLGSVIACVAIAWRMGTLDREGHPIHVAIRSLKYWPWLFREIVVANIDVAKAILGIQGAKVEPTIFTIPSSQKSELGKVIYANSITLTPGTVTVSLDGDTLEIHALTSGAAEGLATGEMDKRVTELEGEA